MHILLITIRLRMLDSRSLKDKRSVIKSLIDSVRHQLQISIAEVDELETLNLGVVATVAVSREREQLRKIAEAVERLAHLSGADLVELEQEWL